MANLLKWAEMTPIQRFWRNSALNLGFWAISVVFAVVFGPKWGSQEGIEVVVSLLFFFMATLYLLIQALGIFGMFVMRREIKRHGRLDNNRP